MNKIPTLFVRDPGDRRYVTDQVTPGCEWVLAGEGVPTRKYDGTCVAISLRGLFARREVKPGKTPPPGFVLSEHDDTTGKTVGWEPIEQSPFRAQFAEAYESAVNGWQIGTYELCGPKINGNPEGFPVHTLVKHSDAQVLVLPYDSERRLTFDVLRQFVPLLGFAGRPFEGVVWHHPDGRMAKLKVRDLRPVDGASAG